MKRIISMGFLLLAATAVGAKQDAQQDAQPHRGMSLCLVMNNWSSWGIWQFEVNAFAGDRILIGEKANHFRIDASEPGYSHVVDGKTVASYPEALSMVELGSHCNENCPPNFLKRVNWFKERCKKYDQ